MKCKEALDILTQVTGQVQATRPVHEAIAEALRTLTDATRKLDLEAAGLDPTPPTNQNSKKERVP